MAEPKIFIQCHHYSMDTVEREKGWSNVSCLRPPVSSKQTLRYLLDVFLAVHHELTIY